MKIEISDEWLKRLLDAHPDQDVKEALKLYLSDRELVTKHFMFALGDYVLMEMAKQL